MVRGIVEKGRFCCIGRGGGQQILRSVSARRFTGRGYLDRDGRCRWNPTLAELASSADCDPVFAREAIGLALRMTSLGRSEADCAGRLLRQRSPQDVSANTVAARPVLKERRAFLDRVARCPWFYFPAANATDRKATITFPTAGMTAVV